ncbi:MAG TPA: hypothetical protein VKM94_07495 [Blastocatellia bacterium]|nr:hypothetical protein [Blastocatellia bacterium]
MHSGGLLDSLPLWSLLPLTILIAWVSGEIGRRIARYRRESSEREVEGPVGAMVGAMLGLLAFMLAFTFGLAASRFEDRRQAVLLEANAIGTTYLRAEMLPQPASGETRDLLRQYVDIRLEAANAGNLSEAVAGSEELHNRLWSQAVAAAQKNPSPITALFVQSLNEVIDLHAKRIMVAIRSRVPGAIWLTLYLLAGISMAAMGYHERLTSSRRTPALAALVVGFSLVLFLIMDLDRPTEGMLRVSQQSMIDLRNSMTDTPTDKGAGSH